jgi:hypothetical protein
MIYAKVPIPGKPLVARNVTGYSGDKVKVVADGHTYLLPKDKVPAEVHAKLNEALRKERKK